MTKIFIALVWSTVTQRETVAAITELLQKLLESPINEIKELR